MIDGWSLGYFIDRGFTWNRTEEDPLCSTLN